MLFKQIMILSIACLSLQVKAQVPGYLGRRFAVEAKTGIYPTFVRKYSNKNYALKPYLKGQFNFAFVLNKRMQLVVTSSISKNKVTYGDLANSDPNTYVFATNETVYDSIGSHNERTEVFVDLSKNEYSFNRFGVGAELRFYLKKVLAPIGTYFQVSYSTVFSKVSDAPLRLKNVEYYNISTNVRSFKNETVVNDVNRFHNVGFGFFRNLIINNTIGLNFGVEANFRLPNTGYTTSSKTFEEAMNRLTYSQQRDAFKRIFNYGVKVGVVKWF